MSDDLFESNEAPASGAGGLAAAGGRVLEAEGGEYLLRHDAVKLFHHDARVVLEGAAVDVRDAEVAGKYEAAGQFHRPAQGLLQRTLVYASFVLYN